MSEDEAINYLKEDIELYEDGCFISTDDDFKAIRIILNLIDKQQKEIEKLKHLKGFIRIDNNGKMELLKLTDFISKDKIKEKIKELEDAKLCGGILYKAICEDKITILEELVGE